MEFDFQKHKYHIIAGVVVFGLLINFVLIPHLYRRGATNLVNYFLSGWSSGNPSAGLKFWDDLEKYPPIYHLRSHKIEKVVFDRQDKQRHALFYIRMSFSAENILPDNKVWICEMFYGNQGWRVVDFRLE